jgi:hypothetical protein
VQTALLEFFTATAWTRVIAAYFGLITNDCLRGGVALFKKVLEQSQHIGFD